MKSFNFSEAQQRLQQLEEEKQKLDKELRSAQEKITTSEKSKEVLEAKLRVSFCFNAVNFCHLNNLEIILKTSLLLHR